MDSMPLWMRLEEYDYMLESSGVYRADRERLVQKRMAEYEKAEQGESRQRADWDTDVYVVKMVKAERKPNRYYTTADDLTAKYGKPNDEGTWIDKDGKEHYPDWPEDENQWNFVFEVVDGEKAGDWLWYSFVSPRLGVKRDGSWWGKLASLIAAIDKTKLPDMSTGDHGPWALTKPDAMQEFMEKPVRVSVEPKDDPQFAKVLAWSAVKKGYAAPKAEEKPEPKAETPVIGTDDIPWD